MLELYSIALREAALCSVILALVLSYPAVRQNKPYSRSVLIGAGAAVIIGFTAGYIPYVTKNLFGHETWRLWRYVSVSSLFYFGMVLVIVRTQPPPLLVSSGLFLLGFLSIFYEARDIGFITSDIGVMKQQNSGALLSAIGGLMTGFGAFFLLKRYLQRVRIEKAFILPSLVLAIGVLQLAFGGVKELEKEHILVPLQRGFQNFIGDAVRYAQAVLLVPGHPFMKAPFSGLAGFISGDRIALSLTVLFIMTPPLFILFHIFAGADPVVSRVRVAARRRQEVAFFRRELVNRGIPVLTSVVVLIVLIHAVNVSLNPLYDPSPIPVRESDKGGFITIPLSGPSGDLADKKLRKYVYYRENKQIVFLTIMKPDGSVGLALDECEVCRPAEWNVDARGYAQKGENLVCKYCMTPIATPTVNSPGGCNPVPLPFKVEEKKIVVSLNDLISTFEKVQALEKKGTHL